MNHERFEELLPAYLDGTLSAEESARVEAALAESAGLRESLEQYRALEDALVMRREEVPPVDAFVPAIASAPAHAEATAFAPAHQRTPLQRFLRVLVSTPSFAIIACVSVAL